MNPIFLKNNVPKPMLMTKILQLIDKKVNNFKDCGCKINCVKSSWFCTNKDLVTRYVCFEIFELSLSNFYRSC